MHARYRSSSSLKKLERLATWQASSFPDALREFLHFSIACVWLEVEIYYAVRPPKRIRRGTYVAPAGTRSGISEVDIVIVMNGDWDCRGL